MIVLREDSQRPRTKCSVLSRKESAFTMYQFKGFVSLSSLASNAADVVAPIGELSATAATFAKDVKLYASATTEVVLHGFSSKSSTLGKVPTPDAVMKTAMKIAEWVATRQKSIVAGEIIQDFKLALLQQFSANCTNVTCGEEIIANSGHPYPTWISWKSTDYTTDDNLNTLWFSDELFRQQYDEYEIVVVPPLTNIDSFFGTYTSVMTALENKTQVQLFNDISVAKQGYPETILTSEEFDYVNPLNTASLTPTNWILLIYGPRGNDTDAIKAALISYLAKNSSRNLNLWKTIFPDIFKSTEFIFVPKWNQYAVAERSLQVGIYSPLVSLGNELSYLKRIIPDYPGAHIDQYATTMGYPYRSMALSVIGNIDNRGNKYLLTDFYKDLIAVSSTSLDFNRMSLQTQGLLKLLAELVYLAETATLYSALPAAYKKSIRSGIVYLSASYDNITFLVATKKSTPA
jgi:hypothetical protein